MSSRSTNRLACALLAAGAVILSACGSAGSAASSSSSTSNSSSTSAASADGSPTPGSATPTSSAPVTTAAEEKLDPTALVVYNAQHENLTQAWADEFGKANNVKVQLRNGSDLEMANQIVAEGTASPADVFITENSPGMNIVEKAELFQNVDKATLSAVPAQYSPTTGKWVGVAARSTVFVYNPAKLTEGQLPKSLMDLADPSWKGRWAASPGGADFQAIVSAMYELEGADATKAWLTSMKENFKAYKGNTTVMKAVNAGEIDGGVIYHYYWYGDQAGTKENSKNTKLLFFGKQDPGAFVSVSGAGILASSKKKDVAQKFLRFVVSKQGQEIVANNVFEYPVLDTRTETNRSLAPLAGLDAPQVDPATLNSSQVVDLMTEVGLL
ncbi:iron(III) transport system substrate-binding protein [Nakamurella sp. UYEF19]|uniref:iron ABC transporter substrate-binding protein n=1 Tax=Nakamurella sp. UYEF19 TaxID=1756392 RepID=UPI003399EE3A